MGVYFIIWIMTHCQEITPGYYLGVYPTTYYVLLSKLYKLFLCFTEPSMNTNDLYGFTVIIVTDTGMYNITIEHVQMM